MPDFSMQARAHVARPLVAALVAGAALVSACAQTAVYNPTLISHPRTPASDKLVGKILILTDKQDDDVPWEGPPTSFTGSGTKLSIPVGQITREVAVTVLGEMFVDGAAKANTIADAGDYRLIVKPRVEKYSYEYNQLKNAGFAVTPTAVVTLEVSVVGSDGQIRSSWIYNSGPVEMPAYIISGSPGEDIARATHKAIYELMVRAAREVRREALLQQYPTRL